MIKKHFTFFKRSVFWYFYRINLCEHCVKIFATLREKLSQSSQRHHKVHKIKILETLCFSKLTFNYYKKKLCEHCIKIFATLREIIPWTLWKNSVNSVLQKLSQSSQRQHKVHKVYKIKETLRLFKRSVFCKLNL